MSTLGDPTNRDDELIGLAARQVRDALDNAQRAGIAAQTPPAAVDEHTASDADGLVSDSIPGYRIVAERSRGGQGVVYEAIQTATRRRVAVKVLYNLPEGRGAGRLRFEREVQVLAQLRHPNIVTIHDSSDDGQRCYYVMDFIDGQPLDRWLHAKFTERPSTTTGPDRSSSRSGTSSSTRDGRWSINDSLRLFAKVCDALQNAHVRGVIHRDLKPNNVLVDADGEPHVVDFGLAKFALASDNVGFGDMTATGQFVGSLPWSSPEQLADSPNRVDTRSDVYALGVMLYQSLTGQFPYPLDVPMAQAIQNIRTREPEPPSRLTRRLSDDIDTLVLKCLHMDPNQRYQTAGELGQDIERFLQGQPLEARRDSTAYVLRKYASRYRWTLTAGAAFAALMILGAITTTVLWRQAAADRDTAAAEKSRADLRFEQLRSLARMFIYDLDEKIRDLPGSTPARLLITDTARTYLDALAADETADDGLRKDTALAYRKVGEILGRPMHASLGRYDDAIVVLGQAEAMLDDLARRRPDDLGILRELAAIQMPMAEVHHVQQRMDEARAHAQRYLDITRQVAAASGEPRDRREAAFAMLSMADLTSGGDDADQALTLATEAAGILEALPDDAEYPQDLRRDRSVAYTRVGDRYYDAGNIAEALAWYRKSLASDEGRFSVSPDSVTARRDLTVSLLRVGDALVQLGRATEGAPLVARAVELRTAARADDPGNAQALRDLSTACYSQGLVYRAAADAPDAGPKARLEALTQARNAWQRSLDLWQEMVDRGTLREGDRGAGDELRGLIGEVDAQLRTLDDSSGESTGDGS